MSGCAVAVPPAPDAPPPADLPVALAPGVRMLAGGRVLVGGTPLRVLRLTDAGAAVAAEWAAGARVGASPARRALARRLLDAGLLAPRPAPVTPGDALAIVVPVRDRTAMLGRCLDALPAGCPGSPIVVVDDGSADPAAVRAACAGRGAAVVRHEAPRGPAAARNRGLAACAAPFVAFVDSDVVAGGRWSAALVGHFADPRVGAVAPRILALSPASGPIAGYEARHSALDMGAAGGLVAPGRPVPYVPSTVLVVRRAAMGGFDEALHVGEDVDLVWRLARAGWRVRYEPAATVRHDHRLRRREFAARRRQYAASIGLLARRHPEALPAARVSLSMGAPWALALAGHRRLALAAATADVLLLGRRLRAAGPAGKPLGVAPDGLAAALVARGLVATGLGLAHAVRRAWAPPLLLLAPRHPRVRRVLLAAYAAPLAQDALAGRRPPVLADVPLRMLDEAIGLAGTWEGCLRQRTLRPLLPAWHPVGGRAKIAP